MSYMQYNELAGNKSETRTVSYHEAGITVEWRKVKRPLLLLVRFCPENLFLLGKYRSSPKWDMILPVLFKGTDYVASLPGWNSCTNVPEGKKPPKAASSTILTSHRPKLDFPGNFSGEAPLHAVFFMWDTVKFLISLSHKFTSDFDINVPLLSHILYLGFTHMSHKIMNYFYVFK